LTLKVGGSFINLMSAGVFISGPMVYINSGGSAGSAGAANPTAPTDPTDAVDADPGAVTSPPSSQAQTPASMSLQDISPAAASAPAAAAPATPPAGAAPGPEDDVALPVAPKDSTAAGMAAGLQQAAQSGAAFCET
jgi:hypothetical protein